jgi:hypothetical protein
VLYRFEYSALLNFPGFDPYLMMRITDGAGRLLIQNSYERYGQISSQKLANGDLYKYEYRFVKHDIVETIGTQWQSQILFPRWQVLKRGIISARVGPRWSR